MDNHFYHRSARAPAEPLAPPVQTTVSAAMARRDAELAVAVETLRKAVNDVRLELSGLVNAVDPAGAGKNAGRPARPTADEQASDLARQIHDVVGELAALQASIARATRRVRRRAAQDIGGPS